MAARCDLYMLSVTHAGTIFRQFIPLQSRIKTNECTHVFIPFTNHLSSSHPSEPQCHVSLIKANFYRIAPLGLGIYTRNDCPMNADNPNNHVSYLVKMYRGTLDDA